MKMINTNYIVIAVLTAMLSLAHGNAPAHASAPQDDLKSVLDKMNAKASSVTKAKADFEWDVFTAVVKQTDIQTGQIYFRRGPGGPTSDALAIRVVSPAPMHIIIANGKFSKYEPKVDQLTEGVISKDKADYEQIMRLGFGSRGTELQASFEVKLLGWEMVDGVNTAKLELIPTLPSYQKAFKNVYLWIDTEYDIALKQQFFQASGDYRLVHNKNIQLTGRFPEDAFKMEHTNNKVVIH
jgi:outer membrane lipoprotein-sorting protein